MNNKYIYLVFSRTDTWLSRLISVFSNIRYPHVSLSFDNSFTKMYSFGRTNPDNPFSGGFVEENLYAGVFKRSINCQCLIFKLEISEVQYRLLRNHIKTFSSEKNKYRYSFLGLCGILFNKPIKRQYHYFCSQFVSEALMECGVLKPIKAPELTKTDDLFAIQNKETVFEGYINGHYRCPAFSQVSL